MVRRCRDVSAVVQTVGQTVGQGAVEGPSGRLHVRHEDRVGGGFGRAGSESFSKPATGPSVEPCTRIERITAKKTRLKISSPIARPAAAG